MNIFRKIAILWIVSILTFIFFHVITFYSFTDKVYPTSLKTTIGDLARMSYMVDILQERENINSLPKKHIPHSQYQNEVIDMVTIGDSFSNGNVGGLNSHYQDYISTFYNQNVLNINIQNIDGISNYLEIIALFANSGYLEQMGVKYVLIESVQREALERFARNDINLELKSDKPYTDIFKTYNETYFIEELYKQRPSIINNLNINACIYNIKYYIQGYGKLNSSVYVEKLNGEFFTSFDSRKLVFFNEDIKKISLETMENIDLLNTNMNNLAKILNSQNIELIFMPAVDKYNLYRPYIISNNYNESIFFEYLSQLNKNYIFINTKEILSEELKKGQKDIFHSDDTHWSYKASELIIKSEQFKEIFNKGK